MCKMTISKDLFGILYLIDSFGTLKNRIRLQKIVVIAKYKFKYDFSFKFYKYLHGPYCADLKIFIDNLVRNGFVDEKLKNGNEFEYILSQIGIKLLAEMKQTIEPDCIEKLNSVFLECKDIEIPQLVDLAKKAFGW